MINYDEDIRNFIPHNETTMAELNFLLYIFKKIKGHSVRSPKELRDFMEELISSEEPSIQYND
jgi:hypothetical protein